MILDVLQQVYESCSFCWGLSTGESLK